MSLQHGLLGLLTYEDSTGYDLAKKFEDSLNYFWNAPVSQIYRELKRMEDCGWVTSKNVIQEGKPNKKIYSITTNGTEEFQRWLKDFRIVPESSHHAAIMRIFFGQETATENTIALLKEYREVTLRETEMLQTKVKEKTMFYADVIPEGKSRLPYWHMTLELGIVQGKLIAEWAAKCIEKLEKELGK